MTYQEYHDELRKEYEEASQKFLKLDQEVSQVSGFGEMKSVPDYMAAHQRWQIATNNYWGFLSSIRGREINPNEDIKLS